MIGIEKQNQRVTSSASAAAAVPQVPLVSWDWHYCGSRCRWSWPVQGLLTFTYRRTSCHVRSPSCCRKVSGRRGPDPGDALSLTCRRQT